LQNTDLSYVYMKIHTQQKKNPQRFTTAWYYEQFKENLEKYWILDHSSKRWDWTDLNLSNAFSWFSRK